MRLTFFFLAMLQLTILIAMAQQTPEQNRESKPVHKFPSAEQYNTWSLGGHLGFTFPNTDISGRQQFGFGIDVSKFISHSFALQARLMHATLRGTDVNKPQYVYRTNISYDFSLNAIIQMGNISFLSRKHPLAVFASAGFGWLHYSPKVYLDGGRIPLTGIYSQYTSPFDTMYYQGNTDFVFPMGFGVKYHYMEKYSFTVEYSLRRTYSDKLDGFFKLLSADDNYSYLGFGFVYHLGSAAKTLEWTNPLHAAYDEIHSLKAKVDAISKDSDNDGVADVLDKHPQTPAGVMVYGNGMPVDSDSDGVPDYLDASPHGSLPMTNHSVNDISTVKKQDEIQENIRGKNMEVTGIGLTTPAPDTTIIKNADQAVVREERKPVTPGMTVVKKDTAEIFKAINDSMSAVFFKSGEYRINRTHYKTIGNIALIMMMNPEVNFRIIGITDASGNSTYNFQLGKRRAESVKRHLVSEYNINPGRLFTESQSRKTHNNIPASEYRRVEVKVKN